MSKKKKDLRVEILSYIDKKGKKQYYPAMGFPVEIFVINEHSKPVIFTSEHLNCSNFLYHSDTNSRRCLAASLKKTLFLGNYLIHDHFSWDSFVDNSIKNEIKNSKQLTVCTIYLSQFLDIKIIQLECNLNNKNYNFKSLSNIYSNSVWLERENKEMFNLNYVKLKDTRKLLLDYTTDCGVLLKNNNINNYSTFFKNMYGVNFYNILVFDLLNLMNFLLLTLFIFFVYTNSDLLTYLILSEFIWIVFYFISFYIGLFYDVIYLLNFDIFILILSSLEFGLGLVIYYFF